jgi:hypothetical protein
VFPEQKRELEDEINYFVLDKNKEKEVAAIK